MHFIARLSTKNVYAKCIKQYRRQPRLSPWSYLFLLYISDLPKNILSNKYISGDTTVYGCVSKNLDEQSLKTDFFFHLSHPDQWDKNWLVILNISKTKLVTFLHHVAVAWVFFLFFLFPFMKNGCTLNESPYLECLLTCKITTELELVYTTQC